MSAPYRSEFTGSQIDSALTQVREDLNLAVKATRLDRLTGGVATALDFIATVGLTLSPVATVNFNLAGGQVLYYLAGGTDAQNSPTVIRPTDFNASTNAKVWKKITFAAGDLLAANNLSDVASAVVARANLGLAIGSNVQAYSANLDSWAAITTASKLSLTGGTMSGALLAASGLISAPGLSFGSETNSGLYRNAAGDIKLCVGGANRMSFKTANNQLHVATYIPDGMASAPSLAIANDPTSGLYWDHSLDSALTVNGILALSVGANPILQLTPYGTLFSAPLGGGLLIGTTDDGVNLNDALVSFVDPMDPINVVYATFTVNGTIASPIFSIEATTINLNAVLTTTNAFKIGAGKAFILGSGTNQRAGNLTLVGGTKTINNTTVTANTVVILTRKTSGGTIGTSITYTLSAGTSFTVTSDNILDTSTFSYVLIEVS